MEIASMKLHDDCASVVRVGFTIAVFALTVSGLGGALEADTIYNVTAQDSDDFVPFENDGTPKPRGEAAEVGSTLYPRWGLPRREASEAITTS
jgi:hypothetical protein